MRAFQGDGGGGMISPFTYPVNVEVWADRGDDLEALFRELHEEEARAEGNLQQLPSCTAA